MSVVRHRFELCHIHSPYAAVTHTHAHEHTCFRLCARTACNPAIIAHINRSVSARNLSGRRACVCGSRSAAATVVAAVRQHLARERFIHGPKQSFNTHTHRHAPYRHTHARTSPHGTNPIAPSLDLNSSGRAHTTAAAATVPNAVAAA